LKSIARCISDKDWKGLSICTKAGITNKKRLEGIKKGNQYYDYVADKSRAGNARRTNLELENRGRV